ncbi:MAG: hypothetical protein RDU89_01625 [bacterium]|nr:hypothetical protein [bacterium]
MTWVDRDQIRDGVWNMLRVNLGLGADDKLLVITDRPRPEHWTGLDPEVLEQNLRRALLARQVAEVAAEGHRAVSFLTFESTGRSGAEPPPPAPGAMREHDVVVAITSYSLSHTDARQEACRAGARLASMPAFLPEMFYPGGAMSCDYEKLAEETARIASWLTAARSARVTCPAGTDIRFSLEGREGRPDDGIYRTPGRWGNLPAGEAFTAPVEGTGEGRLVVRAGWHPRLEEDMTITLAGGEAHQVTGGGRVGDVLREVLGLTGQPEAALAPRRNLAELGVGTNPNARRLDVTVEAEKIGGTVHLALGDSSHMGGVVTADYHQDFVIPEPDLYLDGVRVMAGGKIVR